MDQSKTTKPLAKLPKTTSLDIFREAREWYDAVGHLHPEMTIKDWYNALSTATPKFAKKALESIKSRPRRKRQASL